ncbi:MAG: filamentous hemagglutinin N-terminal domain-containing protein [Tolypothrix sp. T3-bin4]|nr:filamentous hemagglutinin N-terminal domain-containing protein [Tolypothrix sp. T3-bin4]
MMGGAASGNCAFAQSTIIPDTTLGTENSNVIPNINGLPVEVINGGAIRGQNLFHSFLEFNVSQGRGAYFFSPNAAIQNVLARVTGSNRSQILGTLGTFGNSQPNLFLINPNGIIFGLNASLDVGGSFVGTTANAIRLGDTGLFSATEPASSNLLSINPSALFYNAIASQAQIINRSRAAATVLGGTVNGSSNQPITGLNVLDGKSLLLVGNNVSLESGILGAFGGRVELGGLAEPGTVGLQVDGNNLSLSFPDGVQRADVSLANGAFVDVSTGGGGSIGINARNVNILGGSQLLAGIYPGFGEPNARAGNIEINAQEKVSLNNSAINNFVIGNEFSNFFFPEALGQAGDIIINADSMLVTNNANINTSVIGEGKGNAGNIIINARGQVSFDGGFAFSRLEAGGEGRGGDIRITTDGDVLVTGIPSNVASANIGQLVTATFGNGDAGSVTIKAGGNVSFDGIGSDIFTLVAQDRAGWFHTSREKTLSS